MDRDASTRELSVLTHFCDGRRLWKLQTTIVTEIDRLLNIRGAGKGPPEGGRQAPTEAIRIAVHESEWPEKRCLVLVLRPPARTTC